MTKIFNYCGIGGPMTNYKIIICGEQREAIESLVQAVSENLQLDSTGVALFAMCPPENIAELPTGVKTVAVRNCDRELVPEGFDVITYASDDSTADVVALNVQKRESTQSFEVLFGSSIGRVFIPDGSEYTRDHVLVTVALLCAMGAPFEQVLANINQLLK